MNETKRLRLLQELRSKYRSASFIARVKKHEGYADSATCNAVTDARKAFADALADYTACSDFDVAGSEYIAALSSASKTAQDVTAYLAIRASARNAYIQALSAASEDYAVRSSAVTYKDDYDANGPYDRGFARLSATSNAFAAACKAFVTTLSAASDPAVDVNIYATASTMALSYYADALKDYGVACCAIARHLSVINNAFAIACKEFSAALSAVGDDDMNCYISDTSFKGNYYKAKTSYDFALKKYGKALSSASKYYATQVSILSAAPETLLDDFAEYKVEAANNQKPVGWSFFQAKTSHRRLVKGLRAAISHFDKAVRFVDAYDYQAEYSPYSNDDDWSVADETAYATSKILSFVSALAAYKAARDNARSESSNSHDLQNRAAYEAYTAKEVYDAKKISAAASVADTIAIAHFELAALACSAVRAAYDADGTYSYALIQCADNLNEAKRFNATSLAPIALADRAIRATYAPPESYKAFINNSTNAINKAKKENDAIIAYFVRADSSLRSTFGITIAAALNKAESLAGVAAAAIDTARIYTLAPCVAAALEKVHEVCGTTTKATSVC